MSRITDREPKHWHDADGKHRMTDPRTIDGWHPRFWDADERAYAGHLAAHEQAVTDPEPEPGDTEEISNLLALIAAQRETIRTAAELIAALRAEQHQKEQTDE